MTLDPGVALAMIATGDSKQFESCATARTGPRRGVFPALWNNSEEDDNQRQEQQLLRGSGDLFGETDLDENYSGGIFGGLSMFT